MEDADDLLLEREEAISDVRRGANVGWEEDGRGRCP